MCTFNSYWETWLVSQWLTFAFVQIFVHLPLGYILKSQHKKIENIRCSIVLSMMQIFAKHKEKKHFIFRKCFRKCSCLIF